MYSTLKTVIVALDMITKNPSLASSFHPIYKTMPYNLKITDKIRLFNNIVMVFVYSVIITKFIASIFSMVQQKS